jgi:hypothetical protein
MMAFRGRKRGRGVTHDTDVRYDAHSATATGAKQEAAGVRAVMVSLQRGLRAKDFMVVAHSTPIGNAAAYYPETNALVPLDHVAVQSNTPVSKAAVIRLEPAGVDHGSGPARREQGRRPAGRERSDTGGRPA